MKKVFLLLCINSLTSFVSAQDTIYLRSHKQIVAIIKEIDSEEIKYKLYNQPEGQQYSINKSAVQKIRYRNGMTDLFEAASVDENFNYKYLIQNKFDSIFIKKNFFRVYLTDIFLYKLSVGYERLIGKNYSFEVDAFYKYSRGGQIYAYEESWYKYLIYKSQGGELRMGVSRHFMTTLYRFSVGFSVSYRQQSFSNQLLGKTSYPRGAWSLSQQKQGIGLFVKFNFQPWPQKTAPELFLMAGSYASFTKNQYNWFQKPDYPNTIVTDPEQIPKISSNSMKDGFAFLPFFNVGMAQVIKQPQKGWHKKLKRERDSVQFGKKNIVLFSPLEFFDGAIGLTYIRMFYRQGISLYNSVAVGLNGSTATLSNAALVEKTLLYALKHKNFEATLGLNHNFGKIQKSFPYIGMSLRIAQFEGNYRTHDFVLNKYYVWLNTGIVCRNNWGGSLLFGLSGGHYFNDYISNNPSIYIKEDNFNMRSDGGFNTLGILIQLGQSF